MRHLIHFMAACAVALATAGPVRADLIINFVDTGTDIFATAEGSLNTTALPESLGLFRTSAGGLVDFGSALRSNQAFVTRGGTFIYSLLSGPSFSGPSYPFFGAETPDQRQTYFATESGDPVGLGYTQNFGGRVGVMLPLGYVSGTPISATGTWQTKEFSDLGVSAGSSFTWTWGSGPTSDFLTINVGTGPAIPEPSSLVLSGIGVGIVVIGARRRHRRE